MFESIKNLWRGPTLIELMAKELDEAERDLLKAHTGKEFAETEILYHQARIKRLKKSIADAAKEKKGSSDQENSS